MSCRDVNLFFSTDIDKAIKDADLVFISVCTTAFVLIEKYAICSIIPNHQAD